MYNEKNLEFVDRIEEMAEITLERVDVPTDEDIEASEKKIASGGYETAILARSLLTGDDDKATIKLNVEEGQTLEEEGAKAILKKYWSCTLADQIEDIRSIKDKTGVVFDVKSKDAQEFIECYEHLKELESRRLNFEVTICTALPDLAD